MKIIYITNTRIPTEKAHGYQICKMCEEFSGQGAEIELWVPSRTNRIKQSVPLFYGLKENFKIREIKSFDFFKYYEYLGKLSFWLQGFWFAFKLMFIDAEKNAIIYTRDPEIGWIFSLRGYRTIFELHNWPGKNNLYRFLIKHGDKIVTITKSLKELFLKNNWPENKILVAPDGVDLEKFDINLDKEGARKKINLPLDKKIILYVGHLCSWRGADIMADAAKYLTDYQMIFVGGTGQELKDFQDRYKDRANIKIIPFEKREMIPIYLKAADALILPNKSGSAISERYTSPLKLFEYMASGVPIVASDLPSIREVLNEKNCLFFQANNSESLAEKIKSLFSDEKLTSQISRQAYLDVKQYAWSERAKKIINFIK